MENEKLIAYLYNELPLEEMEEVKKYLSQHPEREKELKKLGGVRGMLGKLEDKEVIEPVFIWPDEQSNTSESKKFYQSSIFKTACSITLLLVFLGFAGQFSNAKFEWGNNGIQLSFQEKTEQIPQAIGLTAADVESIIDKKLGSFSEVTNEKLEGLSTQLTEVTSQKTIDPNTMTQNFEDKTEQLRKELVAYMDQISEENRKVLGDLVLLASKSQQDQFESTLVEFSKYLEQKRNEDLDFILLALQDIQQHSDNYKSQTNEILASLIETVNER